MTYRTSRSWWVRSLLPLRTIETRVAQICWISVTVSHTIASFCTIQTVSKFRVICRIGEGSGRTESKVVTTNRTESSLRTRVSSCVVVGAWRFRSKPTIETSRTVRIRQMQTLVRAVTTSIAQDEFRRTFWTVSTGGAYSTLFGARRSG